MPLPVPIAHSIYPFHEQYLAPTIEMKIPPLLMLPLLHLISARITIYPQPLNLYCITHEYDHLPFKPLLIIPS